jgi:ABC-type transport system substrate-binding protein
MVRGVALAALAAVLAAPAAAAPQPSFYSFDQPGALYLVLNAREGPLKAPALRQAIALALDRNALSARTSRDVRVGFRAVSPRYLTPDALARARALAAPYRGTILRAEVRRAYGVERFKTLQFQLAQIGLDVVLVQTGGVQLPENPPPDLDIAFWRFFPDYRSQPPSAILRWAFGEPVSAIRVASLVDHVFVSGRVGPVTYNPVYGVDLAALALDSRPS